MADDPHGQAVSRHDALIAHAPAETPSCNAKKLDFSELYKRQAAKLQFALRQVFGVGPPDPEDVAQQAFQKLMERPNLCDIRDVEAYLWRTARNLVLKEKAKDGIRTRYDFEVEQIYFPTKSYNSTPERVLSAKEQLSVVNEVILSMPANRRLSFVLHRIEGLSISETYRRLGVSRQAVMKHIVRAMADIQHAVAGDPE